MQPEAWLEKTLRGELHLAGKMALNVPVGAQADIEFRANLENNPILGLVRFGRLDPKRYCVCLQLRITVCSLDVNTVVIKLQTAAELLVGNGLRTRFYIVSLRFALKTVALLHAV